MGYRSQQCTPAQARRAILLLYALGDLRAQGLLQKKSLWHVGLTGVAIVISIVALFHASASAFTHPLPADATLFAVLALGAFLLLILNALSVGVVSGTSGQEELEALQYLPIHSSRFIGIRVLLSVLRAELVALVFFLPVTIAVAVYTRGTLLPLVCSIATLLTFPLVPAAFGVTLNLRKQKPKLVVWLYLFTGTIAVGMLLAQQYRTPAVPFNVVTLIMGLPLRGLLGLLTPTTTCLFVIGWLALAGCTVGLTILRLQKTEDMRGNESRFSGNVLLRQVVWLPLTTRWSMLRVLGSIALARVSLPLLLISLVSGCTCVGLVLHLLMTVVGSRLMLLPLLVALTLTGVCSSIVLVCFGPLLAGLLGEAKDHRILQVYPISPRTHAGAIYSMLFVVCGPVIAGIALLVLGLGLPSYALWSSFYTISGLLGGGSLLFVALLNRHIWPKMLLWSMVWLLYVVVKLLGAAVGIALYHSFPLVGAGVAGLLLDVAVWSVLWCFVVSKQYQHFVEEHS